MVYQSAIPNFCENLDSNHFMYMKSFTNVQNG